MSSGGAPTGKWETLPKHLKEASVDIVIEAARPRLLVRRPEVPEVEILLEKSEFTIGRLAAEVDLVLDDEWVSRRHARLTVDPRGYFRLEDLGSQNGLKFHGRQVRRLNLIDGDKFDIGKTSFTFRAEMERFRRPDSMAEAPPRPASGLEAPIPEPGSVPEPGPTPDEDDS